jgi:hypothetical protein
MLGYLAVFQPENVHDRHAAVARLPNKMAVHDHQVTFRDQSLEIKPQRRHTQIQTSIVFFLVDVIGLLPFPVRIRPQPLSIIALASRPPNNDHEESDQEDEEESESQP